MFRLATLLVLQIALLSVAIGPTQGAEYGTADEAKAMLERAIAAVKEDKAKALDTFKRVEADLRTATSMCSVPTSPTAYSQRIPTSKVNICKTSRARRAIRSGKRLCRTPPKQR